MGLVLIFAAWIDAQVLDLGHSSWPAREAAQARLDNPLCALFLPRESDDPEVHLRLRQLRTKNLKWFDRLYSERALHAAGYPRWLRERVLDGEPEAFTLGEAFGELHTDHKKAELYFELTTGSAFVPHWCRGAFIPHEFDQFLAHRQAYRDRRAPAPHQKSSP